MQLSPLDWSIVLGYLVFALGIGVYYSRRAGKDSEEYYLAGRSLPWWVLGTSMVATTFAADTPLAITEMSRKQGIWENWFWWNWLLYGLLGVFLFARLWRRADILTENELIELRYSGKPAAFLRAFKAGYFAILYNFIVMAWVINGMASVLAVMLGGGETVVSHDTMIWILVVISVVYALLSGFWGVVVTDVVQFVIAIVGSVCLAVVALNHVGGVDGLMTKLDTTLASKAERLTKEIEEQQVVVAADENEKSVQDAQDKIKALKTTLLQSPDDAKSAIRLVPVYPVDPATGEKIPVFSFAFLNSQLFQFIVLISIMWWSNHSTDGGGYLCQRTMAAKDEDHALAANLWYNFANYAFRTWPWVIVALVSMVMFEDLSAHELGEKAGYPLVMNELLGSGLRGLLLVSFLAAFMSTIDTHLNWGSSYLVHDIYRRFVERDADEKHYVMVGRIITVVLMVVAAIIAMYMTSIEKAWKFVMAMGGGIGLVLILRWFWWRINAWSEISALAVSVLATAGFEVLTAVQQGENYELFSADPTVMGNPFPFHLQLLVIVGISLVTWITVTFLTRPEPDEVLERFYRQVQPGGWWAPIQSRVATTLPSVARGFVWNFVAGMAFVWGGMFTVGYLIFRNHVNYGWAYVAVNVAVMLWGFVHIWRNCLWVEKSAE